MFSKIVFLLFLWINISKAEYGNITVKWTGSWNCELTFNQKSMPCALGKNGIAVNKVEGDGKTRILN